jgi:hypothetical protein
MSWRLPMTPLMLSANTMTAGTLRPIQLASGPAVDATPPFGAR